MEETTNPELQMLLLNKQSGYNYRERRQDDWDENYSLYRDKVVVDRLIQRQSVNIPLMKQTIRTLLKDVDDMPVLYFENVDNDKQAEVFENEYWNWTVEKNNMDVQDIVDKRQVFLYGRSFTQWQIVDGKVKMTVQDPMDILVDRYCDPTDLNTSRFLIHTHIFAPLTTIEKNPDYDKEAVLRLKTWYATQQGLIKVSDNQSSLTEKNQKLADMGVSDIDDPVLGETIVELTLHFVYRTEKNADTGEEIDQIWLYVEADDHEILMKKPLEQVIDPEQRCEDHFWRNHYPYDTWADDVERQDFWSDAIADIVRGGNKVLNAWYSQEVENRTLANLGMNFYDATIEGFTPGSFPPKAFGWYGLPGKPSEVYQKVNIAPLQGNLEDMNFVIGLIEKATGATATQQGVQTERKITLGEVELALGEAKERIKGMSKFYTPSWKRRGELFLKLIEAGANKLDAVKIYKKGKNSSNLYTREISPKDWMTKSGSICKVWSQEEKNTRDTNALQKINFAKNIMPDNQKLNEVYQRKILEFADLTPEEINDIMEYEKQKLENPMLLAGGMAGQATSPQVQEKPVVTPNQPMPAQL